MNIVYLKVDGRTELLNLTTYDFHEARVHFASCAVDMALR